jgi:sugar O-acyltransferase (sialic acid O-acetyltransferase NeuD family)
VTQANRPCIIWGATGQAKVAYDVLLEEGAEVVHLFDNNPSLESPLPGVPVSYGIAGLHTFIKYLNSKNLSPADVDCIAAIGGGNGKARASMTQLMESHGFTPRSLIHRSAIISSTADLGQNLQLLAGSIIGPFATVGDYTIINSGANVDHDCKIGRMCHLAPHAALAGEVVIENNVFVGTNATVLPRVSIGADSVIGAGAVVIKNVHTGSVIIGNPGLPHSQ